MIQLGSATIEGGRVVISGPLGFQGCQAIRLTNYTNDVITLYDVSGNDQSTQYLLPLTQMVYPATLSGGKIRASGSSLGMMIPGSAVPTLLVECSTAPLEDFLGTYPTSLGYGGATASIIARTYTWPYTTTG